MGTEWSIFCEDCDIGRGLDKHWGIFSGADSRGALLDLCDDEIPRFMQYRLALLGSFCKEHEGHKLRFVSEHAEEYYDRIWKKEEDHDRWWAKTPDGR